ARILLNSKTRVKIFVWVCAVSLDLLLILSLWGYYFHGLSTYFVFDLHLLVDIILLLSFSSLALAMSGRFLGIVFGISLLVLSYVALYICGMTAVDSAVLIPTVILIPGLILTLSRSRNRLAPIIIVLFTVAVTAHFLSYDSTKQHYSKDYNWGRLEFYTFSAHIAQQAPWFGIGLRTPRTPYVADYKGWHRSYSEKEFEQFVSWAVSSQNIFLTFMVGFGTPFALIYLFAIVFLLIRLFRATLNPSPDSLIPPLAIFLPVTGAMLHFLVMDILLMPTIAWFFHILLAMIPKPAPKEQREKIKLRSVLVVSGLTVFVALIGILVGTHPAFKPENFPSIEELKLKFKNLPIISALYQAKPEEQVQAKETRAWLTVNIQGYRGIPAEWAILCVLDNSQSMFKEESPWNPNRYATALTLLDILGKGCRRGNEIAIRDFGNVWPLKRKGRNINLRLSRLAMPWTATPLESDLTTRLAKEEAGANNICAASVSALTHDFVTPDKKFAPRILLITDAAGECDTDILVDMIQQTTSDDHKPVIDMALVGASGIWADTLKEMSRETGGFSFSVTSPETLKSPMEDYLNTLNKPQEEPVTITQQDRTRMIVPGETVELQSGLVDLKLPKMEGISDSERVIKDISLSGGAKKTVNIFVDKGHVSVQQ
ncbi:MAG: O-antigen ligase family protein, partial [Desulfomonilaceae bacterium]